MGMDARTSIVYGFSFAGEITADCDPRGPDFDQQMYDEDQEKWLCKAQGVTDPDPLFGYWEASEKLPISVEIEGDLSSGITTDYLCIREATIRGDWDGPTEIPLDHIRQMPEWDAMLREFCEKAGIEFQMPKWYLIASMG